MKELFILKDVKSGEQIFIGNLGLCQALKQQMAKDGENLELVSL